jgi:Protein of unknown function (DUF1236)
MKNLAIGIAVGAACMGIATMGAAQERQHEPGGPAVQPRHGGQEQSRPTEQRGPGATAPERRGSPRTVERPESRGQPSIGQERNRTKERAGPENTAQPQREERMKSERERAGRVQQERRDAERRPEHRDAQVADRYERIRQDRTRLSGEQLARFRSGFDREHARIRNVGFALRVGTRIPRGARLFPIPMELVSFVPGYRDYRYVVVEDTVCIVDPVTYDIVDIIDDGAYVPSSRPGFAELRLSPSERTLVLDSIAPDFPRADVRLRLALGAEIPHFVELHWFPDVVIDRVPTLRNFQFIVAQDDVIIVDGSRTIALVIER